MGSVGGRRSNTNRFYQKGGQSPWGERRHYFRRHSRTGISLEGGQSPVYTRRSPSRPVGGRADRGLVARAGKPRHDLLYASASLSRLGIARVNPALGSARFFPYDRPMYYCM